MEKKEIILKKALQKIFILPPSCSQPGLEYCEKWGILIPIWISTNQNYKYVTFDRLFHRLCSAIEDGVRIINFYLLTSMFIFFSVRIKNKDKLLARGGRNCNRWGVLAHSNISDISPGTNTCCQCLKLTFRKKKNKKVLFSVFMTKLGQTLLL